MAIRKQSVLPQAAQAPPGDNIALRMCVAITAADGQFSRLPHPLFCKIPCAGT